MDSRTNILNIANKILEELDHDFQINNENILFK